MQHELLVHSMYAEADTMDLTAIEHKYAHRASQLGIHGCMVIHKGEVLHYITGPESEVDQFLDFQLSDEMFRKIKKLFSGSISNSCCDKWLLSSDIISGERGSIMPIRDFIKKVGECKDSSVGLKLFSSVSEIMLSEKLYKFDEEN